MALSYHGVRQPSILEVAFVMNGNPSTDLLFESISKLLVNRMPPVLTKIAPFGCGDLGDASYLVALDSNFLTTASIRIFANVKPSDYPELGVRFDQLHPLMFGKADVLRQLAQALGSKVKLLGASDESVVAIQISSGCDCETARQQARNWLLGNAVAN